MNLKPPRSRRGRSLLGLAVAAATVIGFAGAGLATAGPALADPVNNYVGVGSNTTQDVMNAFAATVGDGSIGSYDAVDPLSGDTYSTAAGTTAGNIEIAPEKEPFGQSNSSGKTTLCDFTRPDGSGAGVAAMEYTINPDFANSSLPPAPTGTTQEPGYGCIDFARSSSGPTATADGDLLYIPFAGDVLATATGSSAASTSVTVDGETVTSEPTAITAAGEFSETDLETFYKCTENDGSYTTVTVPDGDVYPAGTTYYVRTSTLTTPPTNEPDAIPVDLMLPQTGSGTRNTWLNDLTGSTTAPTCANDTIVNAAAADSSLDGAEVEENDGLVYTVDPNAIGPLSVAQVIAQSSGHGLWRLGTAVVNDMATSGAPTAPVAPYTGTLGNYNASGGTSTGTASINALYPIWRLVYNVVLAGRILGTPGPDGTNGTVQYMDALGNPDGTFDAGLSAFFSGPTSLLCESSLLISAYGFANLPQTTQSGKTVGCGDISPIELAVSGLTTDLPTGYTNPY